MDRSARLLDLIQSLRRRRLPVTAEVLAQELGVSPRTIYRDIATLIGQGTPVRGEAGIGYVLEAGYDLPPLMFNADEIEAVLLGLGFVRKRGDPELRGAAEDVAAKIAAVLPAPLRSLLLDGGVYAADMDDREEPAGVDEARVREAIRLQRKCHIAYRDLVGDASWRVIWPFGLAYFNTSRVIMAWCELRKDFRHFRSDRIDALDVLTTKYPRYRADLFRQWEREVKPRNPKITRPESSG